LRSLPKQNSIEDTLHMNEMLLIFSVGIVVRIVLEILMVRE